MAHRPPLAPRADRSTALSTVAPSPPTCGPTHPPRRARDMPRCAISAVPRNLGRSRAISGDLGAARTGFSFRGGPVFVWAYPALNSFSARPRRAIIVSIYTMPLHVTLLGLGHMNLVIPTPRNAMDGVLENFRGGRSPTTACTCANR